MNLEWTGSDRMHLSMRWTGLLMVAALPLCWAAGCGKGTGISPADGGSIDGGQVLDGGPGLDGGAAMDGSAGLDGGPLARYQELVSELQGEADQGRREARAAEFADQLARERALPIRNTDSVLFLYHGSGNQAFLAGSFNNWASNAAPMSRVAGTRLFSREVTLSSGRHEYKFIIDGQWQLDQRNPRVAFGGYPLNSVVNLSGSGKGHLELWPGFSYPAMPQPRDLLVYLPPGYDDGDKQYPVLYMHDGLNIYDDQGCCFGHGGWEVNSTLDRLASAGTIDTPIVVGIPHAEERLNEYGHVQILREGELQGGGAPAYGAFLTGVVKPFADQAYRTLSGRENTAVIGSSMGGLVSYYIGLNYRNIFGMVGGLSSAFWWGLDNATDESMMALHAVAPLSNQIFYLDSGGDGQTGDGSAETVTMREVLKQKGNQVFSTSTGDLTVPKGLSGRVYYHLERDALHNETAWRERLWRVLTYFFQKER